MAKTSTMSSNVRRLYHSVCQEVYKTDANVFKCYTCDESQELIICENCFINGKHYEHNYHIITVSHGFCNCGDFTGLVYCTDHHKWSTNDFCKSLYLNKSVRKEFAKITAIHDNEIKLLSRLNQLTALLDHSSEALLIKKYFDSSRAQINGQRDIRLKKFYSVYRKDHEKRFVECGYDRQSRQLLWHGTKGTNLDGILRYGLKLSTKDIKDLLFGNGIYFADRVTNSCNYCDQNSYGFLLLCEVATGVVFRTEYPKKYVKAPDNYDCVQGIGKYIPEPNTHIVYNGIEVPLGKTIINLDKKTSLPELEFDEYVIYNPKRALIKFIVQFEWI